MLEKSLAHMTESLKTMSKGRGSSKSLNTGIMVHVSVQSFLEGNVTSGRNGALKIKRRERKREV